MGDGTTMNHLRKDSVEDRDGMEASSITMASPTNKLVGNGTDSTTTNGTTTEEWSQSTQNNQKLRSTELEYTRWSRLEFRELSQLDMFQDSKSEKMSTCLEVQINAIL